MADDRERRKLTFSERDKLRREGARHDDRARDRGPRPGSAQAVAQKSYRAALEKAFESGKLGEFARSLARVEEPKPPPRPPEPPPAEAAPGGARAEGAASAPAPIPPPPPVDPDRENRMTMLAKIKEAEGRGPISKAIDAFVARYEKLPDDFEVLTKALSHKSDSVVDGALDRLLVMLAKDKPRRGRALAGQVRILEETHDDPELRAKAAAVRAKL